jgi:hypothetical protein
VSVVRSGIQHSTLPRFAVPCQSGLRLFRSAGFGRGLLIHLGCGFRLGGRGLAFGAQFKPFDRHPALGGKDEAQGVGLRHLEIAFLGFPPQAFGVVVQAAVQSICVWKACLPVRGLNGMQFNLRTHQYGAGLAGGEAKDCGGLCVSVWFIWRISLRWAGRHPECRPPGRHRG